MKITVYSKASCMPCAGTKRALNRNNIQFTEIDVTASADAADPIIELGYRGVPVVVVEGLPDGTDHWDGYRPDKIEALAFLLADGRGA